MPAAAKKKTLSKNQSQPTKSNKSKIRLLIKEFFISNGTPKATTKKEADELIKKCQKIIARLKLYAQSLQKKTDELKPDVEEELKRISLLIKNLNNIIRTQNEYTACQNADQKAKETIAILENNRNLLKTRNEKLNKSLPVLVQMKQATEEAKANCKEIRDDTQNAKQIKKQKIAKQDRASLLCYVLITTLITIILTTALICYMYATFHNQAPSYNLDNIITKQGVATPILDSLVG